MGNQCNEILLYVFVILVMLYDLQTFFMCGWIFLHVLYNDYKQIKKVHLTEDSEIKLEFKEEFYENY